MTEGLQFKPQEEGIRLIRSNERFAPFEGVKQFLPADLDISNKPVLESPIEFQGIRGSIVLVSEPAVEELPFFRITPLGEARSVTVFKDPQITIEQVPLLLEIDFELTSQEDLQRLKNSMAAVDFGPTTYYLPLVDLEDPERIEELRSKGRTQIRSSILTDKEGNQRYIGLLPYNLDRLSQIKLTFIPSE